MNFGVHASLVSSPLGTLRGLLAGLLLPELPPPFPHNLFPNLHKNIHRRARLIYVNPFPGFPGTHSKPTSPSRAFSPAAPATPTRLSSGASTFPTCCFLVFGTCVYRVRAQSRDRDLLCMSAHLQPDGGGESVSGDGSPDYGYRQKPPLRSTLQTACPQKISSVASAFEMHLMLNSYNTWDITDQVSTLHVSSGCPH